MMRRDLQFPSTRTIRPVLTIALTLLLATRLQAQTWSEAKCTGKPDVPWSEQIAACAKVIESGKYAGSDLAKAFKFRGNAYAQTGDLDRGLADLEQSIRLDPNDAFAVGARGDLHLVKKEYQLAIADYTTMITMDPNNALGFAGRGLAHFMAGQFERAIADFDQAVRIQPTLAAALYWRGLAKRNSGDTVAGDADIGAARTVDPDVDRR